MAVLIGLMVFVAVGLLITYAHSHRADGKASAVWDCGDATCHYRNRAMHRHPASAA
jgi:hypothetical protein